MNHQKPATGLVFTGWLMVPPLFGITALVGSIFLTEEAGARADFLRFLSLATFTIGLSATSLVAGALVAVGLRNLANENRRRPFADAAKCLPPAWLGALTVLLFRPEPVVPAALCAVSFIPVIFAGRWLPWADKRQLLAVVESAKERAREVPLSGDVIVRCVYSWSVLCVVVSGIMFTVGGSRLAHFHPFLFVFTFLVTVSSLIVIPGLFAAALWMLIRKRLSASSFLAIILPFSVLAAGALVAAYGRP